MAWSKRKPLRQTQGRAKQNYFPLRLGRRDEPFTRIAHLLSLAQALSEAEMYITTAHRFCQHFFLFI
jgi:hypothetical protein